MIAKLRRTQFGRSSEQLGAMIKQLQLSLEEFEVSQAEVMPITGPAPRAVSRSKPLPEHLPAKSMSTNPTHTATVVVGALRELGEGVSEGAEYVPARLWTYVRDDLAASYATPAAVWCAYSPDRKGQHPSARLKHFSGILQADGYAGFAQLYRSGKTQEVACWAHARRKFYDVYKVLSSPLAGEALQRITSLYDIESEIRGQPPDWRKVARQSRASPLLEQLHARLNQTVIHVSKRSELGGAIFYTLNRCQALVRRCDDGRIEIDNSAAERALRTVAWGLKNYLFVGTGTDGERAAAIYNLVGSTKLNHLNPQSYLTHVLERIAEHPVNRIYDLSPWIVYLTPTEINEVA